MSYRDRMGFRKGFRFKGKPTHAGSVLQKLLRGMKLDLPISRHGIASKWSEIVDPVVARHARVGKVSGATIHIVVDSAVWMSELVALRRVLLEKINAHLDPDAPPIRDIRFYQRSWASTPSPSSDSPHPEEEAPFEPSQEQLRSIRLALQPIKDEELRRVFERIMLKDFALKNRRE